ncbi:hypothetical protein D3C72_2279740 [compost metagenome]
MGSAATGTGDNKDHATLTGCASGHLVLRAGNDKKGYVLPLIFVQSGRFFGFNHGEI